MNIRYRVDLNEAERNELTALLSGGKHAARKLKRAQILLAADAGASDETIASTVRVSGSTVYRTKRRFVEGNLELALKEEPRPGAARKLTGKETALLVATACSNPPEGRKRWTLDLLAEEMVKLTEHDELSRETVRRRLAEDDLKPWRKDMWCIPQVDGAYVARMEDVLDLYAEEADPKRPVVCFDESPTQLIGEVRLPIPAAPGQLERYDCEYRRNGTVNLKASARRHSGGAGRAFGIGRTWIATSVSTPMRRTNPNQFIEVRAERLEGAPVGERRRWSDDFKHGAIAASLEPGTNLSALARSLDITPSQLFAWRRAAALRAERIERQAPVEPRAAKTHRAEIEIGGALVRVSADISETDLCRLLRAVREA